MTSIESDAPISPVDDRQTVTVRRHAGDWLAAEYRIEEVEGVRWDSTSGGVNRRSPYPMLFGYVVCDGMVSGELAHSGRHGACPHTIKVVIQKRDNPGTIYKQMAAQAGPKPAIVRYGRPHLVREATRRYSVWRWDRKKRGRECSGVMTRTEAFGLMHVLREHPYTSVNCMKAMDQGAEKSEQGESGIARE